MNILLHLSGLNHADGSSLVSDLCFELVNRYVFQGTRSCLGVTRQQGTSTARSLFRRKSEPAQGPRDRRTLQASVEALVALYGGHRFPSRIPLNHSKKKATAFFLSISTLPISPNYYSAHASAMP